MGKLTFQNGKYFFQTQTVAELEQVKALGLKYDVEALRWATRSAAKAAQLRRHADPSAELKLKNTFITDLAAPEQISYPDHLSPKLFQIESAWHICTRSPSYCADEAGLGKTITSILAMNSVPGRVFIVCPAFLKYNWFDEIMKWRTFGGTVGIVEDTKSEGVYQTDVVIIPDSLVAHPHVLTQMKRWGWRWGFFDEFHRFKSEEAQRTLAVVGSEEGLDGIANLAERPVFLSGTPIPNGRPIELYPALSRLAPESIGHLPYLEFGKRYCAGKQVSRYEGKKAIFSWDFKGASNLKELRGRLRDKLMIRHLKKDVLTELPPKQRRIIFLDKPEKLEKYEKRILATYSLDDLLGDDFDRGDIATYRREVAESKIQPALEIIRDRLESHPEKVVVFAHHISVVEALFAGLKDYGSLMVRGGKKSKTKQESVKLFQFDNEHRVIVGNLEAMGVGNTLTMAPHMYLVEIDWRPGINEQAEDRIHRMTQGEHCTFDYLIHRGSLDERMLRSSIDKDSNIKTVMS